jgi:hypothetical protein
MTTSVSGSNRNPAPVWIVGPVVAVAVALTLTWMRHANTSYAAAECSRLYHEARSASDTARVDSTRVSRDGKVTAQSSSCGGIRTNARWR